MKNTGIQPVVDYLKDLEEGLVEWDYRGIITQLDLTQMYSVSEVC